MQHFRTHFIIALCGSISALERDDNNIDYVMNSPMSLLNSIIHCIVCLLSGKHAIQH